MYSLIWMRTFSCWWLRTIPGRCDLLCGVHLIRLFLIDDHRMFADVLVATVDTEADMTVVGSCTTTEAGLPATLAGRAPDVVTIEVEPVACGLVPLVGRLREALPQARFVALTGSRDASLAVRAARAGIDAWIPKDSSTETTLRVLRRVSAGHGWFPPEYLGEVLRGLRADAQENPQRRGPLQSLSEREHEVLVAMVNGARSADIAQQMRVSRNTVRTHTRNIFRKLNAHSGLEVVKIARAAGIEPRPRP